MNDLSQKLAADIASHERELWAISEKPNPIARDMAVRDQLTKQLTALRRQAAAEACTKKEK